MVALPRETHPRRLHRRPNDADPYSSSGDTDPCWFGNKVPELIHQGGIIYSFGSSVSCARSLRVARVHRDLSYADVGKAWVSADDLPIFKTLSSVATGRRSPTTQWALPPCSARLSRAPTV